MQQRAEFGCIVPYSLYTPCVLYVIYAIDMPHLGVYVGRTYYSTMVRATGHIHAARAHLRDRAAGCYTYSRAHKLYDMWAEYGLHRFAWMAFEQLGEPRDVDADEFGEIHGPAEAYLIDRLQALWPHGFNIATSTEEDNRTRNYDRNVRRHRYNKRDRASFQEEPQPQDTAAEHQILAQLSPAQPPPLWVPAAPL